MTSHPKAHVYRRAAYAVLSAVLAVLGAAGVITTEQADTWLDIITRLLATLIPLAGSVGLAVAAAKTRVGSDDPTTQQDVELARAQGRADALAEIDPHVEVASAGVEGLPSQVLDPGLPVYDGPTSTRG